MKHLLIPLLVLLTALHAYATDSDSTAVRKYEIAFRLGDNIRIGGGYGDTFTDKDAITGEAEFALFITRDISINAGISMATHTLTPLPAHDSYYLLQREGGDKTVTLGTIEAGIRYTFRPNSRWSFQAGLSLGLCSAFTDEEDPVPAYYKQHGSNNIYRIDSRIKDTWGLAITPALRIRYHFGNRTPTSFVNPYLFAEAALRTHISRKIHHDYIVSAPYTDTHILTYRNSAHMPTTIPVSLGIGIEFDRLMSK